jgi:hypothetical protein
VIGRTADLRGDKFHLLNLGRRVLERSGLDQLEQRAILHDERNDAEQRTGADANADCGDFPMRQRALALRVDEIGCTKAGGVSQKERPLGDVNLQGFSH